jgi:membrane protein implicated in regulation of membrane protease activity
MMDWLGDNAWAAWLSASILFVVAETLSMDAILLMLAAGAGVGMLAALLGLGVVLQVVLASATAIAALALVRPSIVKRLHSGPELALGHSKLVGRQGLVVERISALEPGRIRLEGEIWSAQPYDETVTIEPGETVDVMQIRGATALVHPVPRLES